MSKKTMQVTCTAPVNIAVIKYWGKRDEKLILPTNGSISATLHHQQLRAKTTIMASSDFKDDRMWLNGEEQLMSSPRLQNVLREMRHRGCKRNMCDDDVSHALQWKVHICSENNFPTAAGLASSAAGYACLVYTLSQLFDIDGDISDVARLGSGSACRSVYGGFVEWLMGTNKDGTDSIAKTVAAETHWPEMRVLIVVVSGRKKPIGSTAGMQTSLDTSALLAHRIKHTVLERLVAMRTAIKDCDFDTFAKLTMKDSNEMHACCLDTYPPISYMVDTSHDIQKLVHAVNSYYGNIKVAYTFDAGPNACLYLLQQDVAIVTALLQHFFSPVENGGEFLRGLPVEAASLKPELIESVPVQPSSGAVQYIIHTKVGPGPQVLDTSESLLDANGLPK